MAFSPVLELSTNAYDSGEAGVGVLLTTYPGPRHLAALLLAAYDGTSGAAVTKIDPPPGADADFWRRWLEAYHSVALRDLKAKGARGETLDPLRQ